MSENSSPPGGFNPGFKLSDSIAQAEQDTLHLDMPIFVQAAEKVMGDLRADSKSNLLNQHTWVEDLNRTIATLNPTDQVSVAVSDLNNFKQVNDELGHNAGDELLGIVGLAFKEAFKRESDVVAHGSREQPNEGVSRLGGDEFAVFVVQRENKNGREANSLEAIQRQSEMVNVKLNELLKGTKYEHFNVSLSTGVAELLPGESAEEVFAKADMAMFEIKYSGKIQNVHDLTPEDRQQLVRIIPILKKIGHRVESWAELALHDAA